MELTLTGFDDANGRDANSRSLVEMSQGNDTVQYLGLYLYESYRRDCKCLESLANLKALQVLTIYQDEGKGAYMFDPEEPDDILFWLALAGALGRVQHHIELQLKGNRWLDATFTNFAVAMQGVSNIRTFHSSYCCYIQLALLCLP
jgi:hypothetical protein